MDHQVGLQYSSNPETFARPSIRPSTGSNPSQPWRNPYEETMMPSHSERQISTSGMASGMNEDDFEFANNNNNSETMTRMLESDDTPWDPVGVGLHCSSTRRGRPSINALPGYPEYMEVTQRLPSDIQSTESARIDSAYFSATNHDSSYTVGAEEPQYKRHSPSARSFSGSKSTHDLSQDTRINGRGKQQEFPCPLCSKRFKCRSDYNKHEKWHKRPFKCDIAGCERDGGFITKNDLDRHKKSKHYNGVYGATKSFQCRGKNCRNPQKIWPRLDNFKQHVAKMHKEEDLSDVINRSRLQTTNTVETTVEPAIDPTSISMPMPMPRVEITHDSRHNSPSCISPVDHNMLSPTDASSPRKRSRSRTEADEDTPSIVNSTGSGIDAILTAAQIQTARTQNLTTGGLSPSPAPPTQDFIKAFSSAMTAVTALLNTVQGSQTNAGTNSLMPPNKKQKTPISSSGRSDCSSQHRSASNAPNSPAQQSIEVLKLFETIVTTMAQPPTPLSQDPDTPEHIEPSKEEGGQRCHECGKVLKRKCDMNKHMKRHTRPYGCTFEGCNKTFGSKNDWKRHENSQHFQGEMFKCQESKRDNLFGKCEFVAWKEELMLEHLEKHHYLEGAQATRAKDIGHVRRNNQGRFWCGFCGEAVLLAVEGVGAWDERFNHIDEHFMKEGKQIDDWVDPEHYKKKKDLRHEKDEQEELYYQFSNNRSNSNINIPSGRPLQNTSPLHGLMHTCCKCDQVNNTSVANVCTHCHHSRCGNCKVEAVFGS